MEGFEPIKITKKEAPVPVFREKINPSAEVGETSFSDEQDNTNNYTGELGEKVFTLINNDDQDTIARIQYDYPKDSAENLIKVRFAGTHEKYQGQSVSLKLYEHLLEIAKTKGLEGIASDSAVQAGAMSVWKKLIDKGYNVEVNPLVEEKWKSFLETYNEGKYFRDMFNVPSSESVFKIYLNQEHK